MFRIISALLLAVTASLSFAGEPLQLADNAPDRHIVVKGDTLWDISGKFLKQPWRWPEIWRLNKDEIKNPHWIYPGDVILLDRSSGEPRLRLAKPIGSGRLQPKIYEESLSNAIPPIPPNVIEPFISQPLVIEQEKLKNAARIVATQEDRVILGKGDVAYASGIKDEQQRNWQIFRPGQPLKDPQTGKVLGYEAYYLGTAQLLTQGTTATIEIGSVKEEVGRGDYLVPTAPPTLNSYVPHRPEQDISARVMSIYGGINEGGRYSVIAINRGKDEGLEPGHVLAMFRTRNVEILNDEDHKQKVDLPPERYGLAFIFRTFDHISYALVVAGSRPVTINDLLNNP
jgi:hypothetical protein